MYYNSNPHSPFLKAPPWKNTFIVFPRRITPFAAGYIICCLSCRNGCILINDLKKCRLHREKNHQMHELWDRILNWGCTPACWLWAYCRELQLCFELRCPTEECKRNRAMPQRGEGGCLQLNHQKHGDVHQHVDSELTTAGNYHLCFELSCPTEECKLQK